MVQTMKFKIILLTSLLALQSSNANPFLGFQSKLNEVSKKLGISANFDVSYNHHGGILGSIYKHFGFGFNAGAQHQVSGHGQTSGGLGHKGQHNHQQNHEINGGLDWSSGHSQQSSGGSGHEFGGIGKQQSGYSKDIKLGLLLGAKHEHSHSHKHEGHKHEHSHSHEHLHGHEKHVHIQLGHEIEHSHGHNHGHSDGHKHHHSHGHNKDINIQIGYDLKRPQEHKHDHAHDHKHDHSHDHKHDHSHDHKHDHSHDHKHDHSHDHKHDHSHDHKHDHSHDHKHDHSHDHKHDHSHDHKHDHSHDHKHDHKHDHSNGHKHEHSHGHKVENSNGQQSHDHGGNLNIQGGFVKIHTNQVKDANNKPDSGHHKNQVHTTTQKPHSHKVDISGSYGTSGNSNNGASEKPKDGHHIIVKPSGNLGGFWDIHTNQVKDNVNKFDQGHQNGHSQNHGVHGNVNQVHTTTQKPHSHKVDISGSYGTSGNSNNGASEKPKDGHHIIIRPSGNLGGFVNIHTNQVKDIVNKFEQGHQNEHAKNHGVNGYVNQVHTTTQKPHSHKVDISGSYGTSGNSNNDASQKPKDGHHISVKPSGNFGGSSNIHTNQVKDIVNKFEQGHQNEHAKNHGVNGYVNQVHTTTQKPHSHKVDISGSYGTSGNSNNDASQKPKDGHHISVKPSGNFGGSSNIHTNQVKDIVNKFEQGHQNEHAKNHGVNGYVNQVHTTTQKPHSHKVDISGSYGTSGSSNNDASQKPKDGHQITAKPDNVGSSSNIHTNQVKDIVNKFEQGHQNGYTQNHGVNGNVNQVHTTTQKPHSHKVDKPGYVIGGSLTFGISGSHGYGHHSAPNTNQNIRPKGINAGGFIEILKQIAIDFEHEKQDRLAEQVNTQVKHLENKPHWNSDIAVNGGYTHQGSMSIGGGHGNNLNSNLESKKFNKPTFSFNVVRLHAPEFKRKLRLSGNTLLNGGADVVKVAHPIGLPISHGGGIDIGMHKNINYSGGQQTKNSGNKQISGSLNIGVTGGHSKQGLDALNIVANGVKDTVAKLKNKAHSGGIDASYNFGTNKNVGLEINGGGNKQEKISEHHSNSDSGSHEHNHSGFGSGNRHESTVDIGISGGDNHKNSENLDKYHVKDITAKFENHGNSKNLDDHHVKDIAAKFDNHGSSDNSDDHHVKDIAAKFDNHGSSDNSDDHHVKDIAAKFDNHGSSDNSDGHHVKDIAAKFDSNGSSNNLDDHHVKDIAAKFDSNESSDNLDNHHVKNMTAKFDSNGSSDNLDDHHVKDIAAKFDNHGSSDKLDGHHVKDNTVKSEGGKFSHSDGINVHDSSEHNIHGSAAHERRGQAHVEISANHGGLINGVLNKLQNVGKNVHDSLKNIGVGVSVQGHGSGSVSHGSSHEHNGGSHSGGFGLNFGAHGQSSGDSNSHGLSHSVNKNVEIGADHGSSYSGGYDSKGGYGSGNSHSLGGSHSGGFGLNFGAHGQSSGDSNSHGLSHSVNKNVEIGADHGSSYSGGYDSKGEYGSGNSHSLGGSHSGGFGLNFDVHGQSSGDSNSHGLSHSVNKNVEIGADHGSSYSGGYDSKGGYGSGNSHSLGSSYTLNKNVEFGAHHGSSHSGSYHSEGRYESGNSNSHGSSQEHSFNKNIEFGAHHGSSHSQNYHSEGRYESSNSHSKGSSQEHSFNKNIKFGVQDGSSHSGSSYSKGGFGFNFGAQKQSSGHGLFGLNKHLGFGLSWNQRKSG